MEEPKEPKTKSDPVTVLIVAGFVLLAACVSVFAARVAGVLPVAGILAAVLAALIVVLVVALRQLRKLRREADERLKKAEMTERSIYDANMKMLTSLNHDIRTPINTVMGIATIAKQHTDDPAYIGECLDKISLTLEQLLHLTNDILDISKVESGRMELSPVAFSLAEMADSLIDMVRSQIKAKNITFDVRIHRILHEYIYADKLRLNQIFSNILTNAVKYTPDGGRITLDMKERPRKGRKDAVRLSYIVEDNGIGMSQEFQKTMYDSFSRAADERGDKVQGSGLGLSVCKQMVELMGGTIDCESKPGQGTKFTVELDVAVADGQMTAWKLPPVKLLLLDDDEHFLASASDLLSIMGAKVDCITDCGDVVTKVTQQEEAGAGYQAVVLEWNYPGVSIRDIVRSIREAAERRVPILISSYDWAEIEEEALAAGADGFVGKPFFCSTIYSHMNSVLRFDSRQLGMDEEDTADLAGMHILVAEDDDLNWEILDELLRMHGIFARRAANGSDCVDIIQEAKDGAYDMILMDVQMPVMDGLEATQIIRGMDERWAADIPIIALTADAFSEDEKACLEAGMNGHLPKPIDMKKLIREMRRARQQL